MFLLFVFTWLSSKNEPEILPENALFFTLQKEIIMRFFLILPICFSEMSYLPQNNKVTSDAPTCRQRHLIAYLAVLFSLIVLFSPSLGGAASAPKSQEAAWQQALLKSTAPNEIKWLNSSDEKFIALYRNDTRGTQRGGLILLHEMGGHPDWPEVISPLRNSLPQHGWFTLSIQLPAFESDALISDYASSMSSATQRIQAAIAHFRALEINNIILLGYGLGATMAASFLATNEGHGVIAFVAVSILSDDTSETWLNSPKSIEKLKLPMLDIYGSNDLNNVVGYAGKRAHAARRSESNTVKKAQPNISEKPSFANAAASKATPSFAYRKIQITGARHSFNGQQRRLNKRITGWLKQYGAEITSAQ